VGHVTLTLVNWDKVGMRDAAVGL